MYSKGLIALLGVLFVAFFFLRFLISMGHTATWALWGFALGFPILVAITLVLIWRTKLASDDEELP
jgi:hypothetical protein